MQWIKMLSDIGTHTTKRNRRFKEFVDRRCINNNNNNSSDGEGNTTDFHRI